MDRIVASYRSMKAAEKGASALEFSLICPVFFAFIFAIFDAGGYMLRDTMLHSAVDMAGRELRVDGTTRRAETVGTFRQRVCDRTHFLGSDCSTSLAVEVTHVTDGTPPPTGGMNCDASQTPATQSLGAAAPLGIIYLRVCYPAESFFPTTQLGLRLPQDTAGRTMMIASTAYRNEL